MTRRLGWKNDVGGVGGEMRYGLLPSRALR